LRICCSTKPGKMLIRALVMLSSNSIHCAITDGSFRPKSAFIVRRRPGEYSSWPWSVRRLANTMWCQLRGSWRIPPSADSRFSLKVVKNACSSDGWWVSRLFSTYSFQLFGMMWL